MSEKFDKFCNNVDKCINSTSKTITYCKNKCDKSRIVLLCDIILSRILYKTNLEEYEVFEFYDIDHNHKRTYLPSMVYEKYKKYLYNTNILNILNDKDKLYTRLKPFMNRDIHNVLEMSFKEFELYSLKNNNLLGRSKTKSFISSNKKYYLSDYRTHAYMLDKIKSDGNILIEPIFNQHEELEKISNNLVTIVIITLTRGYKTNIVSTSIKFKDAGRIINGHVDLRSLSIKGHLRDENNCIYDKEVDGYKLSCIDSAIKLVSKLSYELSEIQEIEWSICINQNGEAYLVDANVSKDLLFEQTPEYLKNRVGLKPLYKRYLSKK